MRIRVSSIRYLLFVLIVWALSAVFGETLTATVAGIKTASIGQFIVFVLLFFAFGKAQGELFSLYAIWMIAFYVFQNGQILLYSLGFDYDYWYVTYYSKKLVFESIKISMHSLCAAFAAGVFAFEKERPSAFMQRLNSMDESFVSQSARLGWLVTGLVAWGNLLIKMAIVLSAGYSGVLVYEESVPTLIGLIEYFYPVFTIMIVAYQNRGRFVNFVVLLFLIWGVMTSLTGDRTSGIAAIVLVAIMYIKHVYLPYKDEEKSRKKHWGRNVIFVVIAVLSMYLIAYAFDFRAHSEYEGFDLIGVVVRTVGELGFSFFPLVLNMQIYPSNVPFMQGKSLIASVICSFFPRTIDVAGITTELADLASAPMRNIERYFNYNFGLDCSLIAEGYANFGDNAWIAVFIVCCVVAGMLKKVDYHRKDNRFVQYLSLALLFVWFTVPRRRSYYVYNAIFWICIVMSLFLKFMHDLVARRYGEIKE